LLYTSSTTTTVSFSWSQNADNGGAVVFDYAVYWDGGDSSLTLSQFIEASDTTYNIQTHTETGLMMGSYYRFSVIA